MPGPDFSNKPIPKLISLKGKTAVITSGARGIGLAKEWGQNNIYVVAIAPTHADTPSIYEQMEDVGEKIKRKTEQSPLGHISVLDDITRIALVLVSDLAAYVTWSTFVMDGGDMTSG